MGRSASGWEVAKSYREVTSVLLGVITIPQPTLSIVRTQRNRSWSSSMPVELIGLNTNKNEILTRGVNSTPSAAGSADNEGRSIESKRDNEELDVDEGEGQDQGLSADKPRFQSIISDSAVALRKYIRFFVARTSLLQTVERSNSGNMLDIEMRESRHNQHHHPITVRVNSGELDGGDGDF